MNKIKREYTVEIKVHQDYIPQTIQNNNPINIKI